MAQDSHDRWLFLLTLAALPLACTEEVPGETTDEGSTGTGTTTTTTTTMPSGTTTMPTDTTTEGSTSIVTTTGVEGTSSSGGATTVVDESSSGTSSSSSSSSDGTTMSIDPSTSTGEESSTTEEPPGVCEVWGEAQGACTAYDVSYFIDYCYDYIMDIDIACWPTAEMVFLCEAYSACGAACTAEDEALDECEDMALAAELGCAMIAEVPAAGTIEMQCEDFMDHVWACTAAGYYIPFFSGYAESDPYAEVACVYAFWLTYSYVPQVVGDPCSGAYEELHTCLSGLSCAELENVIYDDSICETEQAAIICRCDLGV